MSTPNPFAQFVETTEEKPAEQKPAENPFSQFISDDPPEETTAEQTENDPGLKQVAPGIFIRADRSIAHYITGGAEVLATVAASAKDGV